MNTEQTSKNIFMQNQRLKRLNPNKQVEGVALRGETETR